jgi:hypothetical protein
LRGSARPLNQQNVPPPLRFARHPVDWALPRTGLAGAESSYLFAAPAQNRSCASGETCVSPMLLNP